MSSAASDPCFIMYFSGGNFHHLPKTHSGYYVFFDWHLSIMPCKVLNTGAYLNNRVKAGLITREDEDLIYEFCEELKP